MQSESLAGTGVEFFWPISPSAVAEFAQLTGDDHPIHVDDAAAREAGLPGRIVQGSYLVAIMANAASRFFKNARRSGLSYGYDKLRFTSPVATNDTLHVKYEIGEHDPTTGRMRADVSITKSNGELAVVAVHLTKCFEPRDLAVSAD